MNRTDMLLWVAYVLVVPAVFLPVTLAGGWFIKYSAVVEDWREWWKQGQAGWVEQFYDIVGDEPGPPPWRARARSWSALARVKAYGLLVCGVCFGWHVAWGILGAQGLVAWWQDTVPLVGWVEALPVYGALVFYHTVAFKHLELKAWFRDD